MRNLTEKEKQIASVTCDQCKYCNKLYFIQIYGTCHLCGKVLDPKAKYKYEMRKKLHLEARKKRSRNGYYCL